MPAAWLVEELADAWQGFDDGLVGGNFAIKDTQWIGDGAALAVSAHLSDDGLKRFAESFVVGGTIVRTADRIQLQRPIFDAEAVEQCGQQLQNFGVAGRRLAACAWRADDLGADLIELPVAPFLWTLAAELWADVIELIESAVPELVLDVSADHASGILGTEGEGFALP